MNIQLDIMSRITPWITLLFFRQSKLVGCAINQNYQMLQKVTLSVRLNQVQISDWILSNQLSIFMLLKGGTKLNVWMSLNLFKNQMFEMTFIDVHLHGVGSGMKVVVCHVVAANQSLVHWDSKVPIWML